MSKKWVVSFPIVGRASAIVTADDEDAAREALLNGEYEGFELEETDIVEQCKGNVCHLPSGIYVEPDWV